jgi:hypothetical protein
MKPIAVIELIVLMRALASVSEAATIKANRHSPDAVIRVYG